MNRTNINAVLKMVKEFLNGEMSRLDFVLDFPHEVQQRYDAMCREDADYADMIYYYLVECGVDCSSGMSESDFYDLIEEQYQEVKSGVY